MHRYGLYVQHITTLTLKEFPFSRGFKKSLLFIPTLNTRASLYCITCLETNNAYAEEFHVNLLELKASFILYFWLVYKNYNSFPFTKYCARTALLNISNSNVFHSRNAYNRIYNNILIFRVGYNKRYLL